MPKGNKPIPKQLKKYLWMDEGVFLGLAMPAIAWAIYIAVAYGGMSISKSSDSSRVSSIQITFYMAVGTTILGPGYALYSIGRWLRLVRNGIIIEGRVSKIGLGTKGLVRLDYSYGYQNKSYTKATSVLESSLEKFRPGAPVQVLMDPEYPSLSLLVDETFPNIEKDPEQLKRERSPDPLTQPTDALKKYKGWWKWLILSAIQFSFAVWLYSYLTACEQSGNKIELTHTFALLYGLFGKWGTVLFLASLGCLGLWFGIRQMVRYGKAKERIGDVALSYSKNQEENNDS